MRGGRTKFAPTGMNHKKRANKVRPYSESPRSEARAMKQTQRRFFDAFVNGDSPAGERND